MLRGLDAAPGTDYRVVTVSIDENETPADARRAKRIALETIERPFPPEDWRFLTGDAPSIARLADSVGFRFRRNAGGFDSLKIYDKQGSVLRVESRLKIPSRFRL